MSGEKDLEQLKKEAAEKAKALAKQRLAENEAGNASSEPEKAESDDADLAKKKAAAAAKAKAAALAKMKAMGEEPAQAEAPAADDEKAKAIAAAKAKAAAAAKAKAAALAKQEDGEAPAADDEKAKAIAAAKAKAAAAAKAKAAALAKQEDGEAPAPAADDEKAKAIAAAKAKAAAAAKAKAAAAAKTGGDVPAAEEAQPSANQPYLDKYVKVIKENLGEDALEDAFINKLSKDVPTLVATKESYYKVAQFLKFNELLSFDYLSNLHATDYETHMEMYVHLFSYKNRQSVALKVKLDRQQPKIESLEPLWSGANWPECEVFDLLGVQFTGHPNLYRIMLGEEWVGHPLRKDYEPYDVEV